MDIGRWIESLLNSNLSTYFDGDARIDLRRGEIEIGPLELKPASLLHSEAAFELRAGHVGKVRIQLPGARSLISWLGEQPPVLDVHVETALVIFGLPTKREWGAEQYAQEAAAKRARHQAAIAAAEQILQGLISGHTDPDAKGRLGSFLRGGSFFSRQLRGDASNPRHPRLRIDNVRVSKDLLMVIDHCKRRWRENLERLGNPPMNIFLPSGVPIEDTSITIESLCMMSGVPLGMSQ